MTDLPEMTAYSEESLGSQHTAHIDGFPAGEPVHEVFTDEDGKPRHVMAGDDGLVHVGRKEESA